MADKQLEKRASGTVELWRSPLQVEHEIGDPFGNVRRMADAVLAELAAEDAAEAADAAEADREAYIAEVLAEASEDYQRYGGP